MQFLSYYVNKASQSYTGGLDLGCFMTPSITVTIPFHHVKQNKCNTLRSSQDTADRNV